MGGARDGSDLKKVTPESGRGKKNQNHPESWQRLQKHLCRNRRAISSEITHCSLSNLAGRWEFGNPER